MAATDLIAIVDTETTGLSSVEHRIWEAAWLIYDRAQRRILSEFCHQIELSPAQLAAADPIALEIGRFAERRLPPDQLLPPGAFIEGFLASTAGLPLVGANPSFDEERLRRLAWWYGLEPAWHYRPICVEALAVGFLHGFDAGAGEYFAGGPPSPAPTPEAARTVPWRSVAVAEALGISRPEEEAHTALGDCRWALAIWRAVMER